MRFLRYGKQNRATTGSVSASPPAFRTACRTVLRGAFAAHKRSPHHQAANTDEREYFGFGNDDDRVERDGSGRRVEREIAYRGRERKRSGDFSVPYCCFE